MKLFGYVIGMLAVAAPIMNAQRAGAVYAQTNSPSGNSVVMAPRGADGRLGEPAYVATGGVGTGSGLGSQGSIVTTNNGQWLLVANAGSNDVSTFSVTSGGVPTLRRRVFSGGLRPTSITVHGDVVFVLNAGDVPNIKGFELTSDGDLLPIPGAAANLQGAGPAQVQFDDHGELLVVTDRMSHQIEVLRFDGQELKALYVADSAGRTPFGFAFGHNNVLIVSEAATSSASSYKLSDEQLTTISPAVGNTQRAACWLVVTNNGRYAYTANAQSRSVSSYRVAPDGSISLIDAVAGQTPAGTAPIDMALSRNSTYLYSLATGTISSFRVSADGSLTSVDVLTDLPTTTVGLAAL